jgi:hypothetical protein
MKYLKSYKLFESVDLIPLVSTINDIALDLTDEGYEVLTDVIWPTKDYDEAPNGEAVLIQIISPRKEEFYSKWRQDRENYAVKEYKKCEGVLDRINDFLESKGLVVDSKNGFHVGSNPWSNYTDMEYGICSQGYDNTGQWNYEIIYKPTYQI